jgi:arylsulfatase A-like enzyme
MLENVESQFEADHVTAGKHSSELFCDAAIDFINSADGEKPFFAYVSFMAPHDPRSMPKEFRDMYNPNSIELPPNFMGMHPVEYGNAIERDEMLSGYPRTPAETRRHIAEYYAMISHLDHEMGRVMAAVESEGIADNTIFVFAGDNGLAIGQHGLMGKQNTYEHSVRVPLVVSGPGIPRGEVRDQFVYLLDIFPTLFDLLGLQTPDTVEGMSFLPVIRDAGHPGRGSLYFAFTDKIRAVKDRRYKLMEHVHEGLRTTQLFDLAEDPWELANLAESAAHRQTARRLRAELFDLRDEWDDETHRLGRSYWDGYRAAKPR